MTFEEINTLRAQLENELGFRLRNFEAATGVKIDRITYGTVNVHLVDPAGRSPPVTQAKDECLIKLTF